MTTRDDTDRLKRRLKLAGALALLAVALTVADRLVAASPTSVVNNFAAAHAGGKPINEAVDALLGEYAFEPKAITTWKVMTPDKKLLRVEQRIVAPHDFASVEFNHKLSQRILPFGARVAATERSRENLVSMHIVNEGVIIRTVSFALRPYEPGERGKVVRGNQAKSKENKGSGKRNAH